LKRNEGKTASTYFCYLYGSETKRKEKYRSEKTNTEAKKCEKEIWVGKRSEKIYAKFVLKHAKWKRIESGFALERKKFDAKPADPSLSPLIRLYPDLGFLCLIL
jgi:hypothetical protein